MAKSFANIRPGSGGGGGAVDSVNGQTGIVILDKGDIGLGNVDNTSDANKPVSTATQAALDLKQDIIVGNSNHLVRFNSVGAIDDVSQRGVNDLGFYDDNITGQPDGLVSGIDINRTNLQIDPLQDSPGETWHLNNNQVQVDPNSSGFEIGTGGQMFRFDVNNIVHNGTSDVGSVEFIQNNFSFGNGTDPIDVNGLGYMFGFGQFNDNVTISGPLQGYGFQLNVTSGATIDASGYVQAFYDNANIATATPGYSSFNASPNVASIMNNHNYNGFVVSPNIPIFTGNASFVGLGVYGNLGTFSPNSSFSGVQVSPTITSARYAAGLNVSMDNVTVYPGVVASLVIQDLTIAANLPSTDGNSVTIEYTGGGTAGSEVVSQLGLAFSVQIESGVSTATQIAAALNAFISFTTNLNVTISGTASNPQVTQAATSLVGGENAGRKQAAYLDGDVEITGSLAFGGALSIGQLNAFANYNVVSGSGAPASVHTIIDAMNVAASATITNADTIGLNTAALITIGNNASVSSAFLGLSALALPAVLSMGTGSTVDTIAGATFALSLDSGATGGTVDNVYLCRALTIPNGTTIVNNLRGFTMDLPFGDPGTNTWGIYISPTSAHNYLAADLKIGGADIANNAAALEIESNTKGFLNARMTTTERDAITAVNGLQIYNNTTNKLQVYAAGAWVDLH